MSPLCSGVLLLRNAKAAVSTAVSLPLLAEKHDLTVRHTSFFFNIFF